MEPYEALLQHSPDGVLVTRPEGAILRANPAACRMLGYTEAQLRALGREGLVVADAQLEAMLEERARTGVARGELQFRRADGATLDVEVTAVLVPTRSSRRYGYVIFRDVTARKQAERALRASEERFRQLAENIREAFWIFEPASGHVLYASPGYEQIWGRSCESLYANPADWEAGIHPDDRRRVADAFATGSAAGSYDEEYRVVRPDGSIRWVRDRAVPVRDADGRVVRTVGIAADVTRRRRTDRALRTLTACNEALVRAASEQALYDALCRAITEVGGYRMCWVGLAEHDAARGIRPVARAGHDDGYVDRVRATWGDGDRGRGPTGTAARTGRPVTSRDFAADPRLAPWREDALARGYRSIAALPIVVEGKTAGVLTMYSGDREAFDEGELQLLAQLADDLAYGVAALRARAERDQLTARLVETDRLAAMGTLAAGVAHEINNPLAYVISSLGFLERALRELGATRAPAFGEALEALADAREGTERVRQIVRDLKAFSRPGDLRGGRTALAPVLDSAISIAAPETKHRARVVTDYGPVPEVVAPDGKLGQVFLNLLVNAAQAIAPGHVEENEIRVSTSTTPDGRARIEVRDTGSGIPPDLLGRIFEPFVTTKDVGEGTGLGLSICKGIVEALGGEIAVESAPGQGATFRVTLPPAGPAARVEPPSAPAPPAPASAPATARRGRVAVVDDEPNVRKAVVRMLRGDHDVTSFERAAELERRVEAGERFDVILSDLMMPHRTGMELFEALRGLAPDQADAMVFITGGAFGAARDFLDRVRNPWLEKPFEPESLRTLVRRLLDGP